MEVGVDLLSLATKAHFYWLFSFHVHVKCVFFALFISFFLIKSRTAIDRNWNIQILSQCLGSGINTLFARDFDAKSSYLFNPHALFPIRAKFCLVNRERYRLDTTFTISRASTTLSLRIISDEGEARTSTNLTISSSKRLPYPLRYHFHIIVCEFHFYVYR